MNEGMPADKEASRHQESVGGAGFLVKPTSDSHFAWLRTRLAADNTLMGWIRLATTLIGFGFTIVQFFDRFEGMSNVKPALLPQMPRYLGLALIFSGVLGLLVSIWQYIWFVDYLSSNDFERLAVGPATPFKTPALLIAVLMTLVGVVALFAVMFRFA